MIGAVAAIILWMIISVPVGLATGRWIDRCQRNTTHYQGRVMNFDEESVRAAILTVCQPGTVHADDETLCSLVRVPDNGGDPEWQCAEIIAVATAMAAEGILIHGEQGQWSLA